MRFSLLFALVACATAAVPRIKRQSEFGSRFWWLQLERSLEAANLDNTGSADPSNADDVVSGGTTSEANNKTRNEDKLISSDDFTSGSGGTVLEPKIAGCDGAETVCVPYYQCKEGNVITDGAGLIDVRIGDTLVKSHSGCPRYLEVCCKIPSETDNTPSPPTVPHTPGCGRRNTHGVHARISGLNVTQTQFGEFPWMVAVLRIENIAGNDVNLYQCGGSLIQPNVILTAAHCVSNFKPHTLKIRAGEWDTQSEYELYPHQDRLVREVIVHPNYDGGSLWNDFALLILASPLDLAPNVDTLCLPASNESFDRVTCIATGWGKDKFGREGRFQNILKQVSLDIVPHKTCENALRGTRLGTHFILDESFVCAGGKKGIDTCKGDGGSPLVCTRPGTHSNAQIYYQVGIVAWGIGCGENGIPGVYADVTKAIDWIYTSMTPYLQ